LAKANFYYLIHYPSAKADGNEDGKAGGNEKNLAKVMQTSIGN